MAPKTYYRGFSPALRLMSRLARSAMCCEKFGASITKPLQYRSPSRKISLRV